MKRLPYGLLVLLLLLLGCRKDDVTVTDSQFIHFFGTGGDDLGSAVVELPDRGFALAGTEHHAGFGADAALLFTDADGTLRNSLTYGGVKDDHAYDMRMVGDGSGFILVGSTLNGDSAGWDMLVIRTDWQGKVIWQRSYGGDGDEEASAVDECADGGFAIVGYTSSARFGATVPAPQYCLLRIDAQGNLLWQKGMGGTREDRARGVDVLANGDWVFCGITKTATADYDASITRVEADGDLLWTYTGISNFHDEGATVMELRNGDLAWVGFTFANGNDYNIVVEVLDPTGLPVSGKRWLSTGIDNDRVGCKRFYERPDGALALAGYTQSKGAGANDIYLLIVDPSMATPLVDRAYGGTNDDIGAAMVHTQDGGYAITGYSKSFNFSETHDIVLVKVDSLGNLGE